MPSKNSSRFPETLTIPVPAPSNRKEFLSTLQKEVQRQGAALWDRVVQEPRNKGGRPSVEKRVFSICREVWNDWGAKFPPKRNTQEALLGEVKDRYGSKFGKVANNTITKHVKRWMRVLPTSKAPPSVIVREFGKFWKNPETFEKVVKGYFAFLMFLELSPGIEKFIKTLPEEHRLGDEIDWDKAKPFLVKNPPGLKKVQKEYERFETLFSAIKTRPDFSRMVTRAIRKLRK